MTSLSSTDVPGANFIFPNVEDHSVMQLKRWLECRGLQKRGNKAELIERCKKCIAAGRADIISVGVDAGKWYEQKCKKHKATHTVATASTSSLSTEVQWKPFPSHDIPDMFNKGHIYAYLVLYAPAQQEMCSEDESDEDFTPATEKPFKRGQQYLDSGFVNKVQDRMYNNYYELKCTVNSSFKKKIHYTVQITLCKLSGSVIKGTCHCKQSSMGRCSHVSAGLLFIWKHVQENGYRALTCTSQPRQWGLGSKNINPQAVKTSSYNTAARMKTERADFDPRPKNYANNFNINDLLYDLSLSEEQTMFQSLLSYKYDDFEYNDYEKQIINKQCNIFYQNLYDYVFKNGEDIVQLSDTIGQANSEKWFHLRTYFITASNVKLVCGFQSPTAKKNFVLSKLWCLDDFHLTKPMKYGIDNEKNALNIYKNCLSADEVMVESGLVVNRKYPFIACSVDGLILNKTSNKKIKIIEIKCPFILRNCNPKDFKTKLTKKQLQTFVLYEENGKIFVKRNHTYYFQMQIGMLIHEVDSCDFILWSEQGILTISVSRENVDSVFITDCLSKINIFYKTLYVPEMFCMRVPRNLLPITLEDSK